MNKQWIYFKLSLPSTHIYSFLGVTTMLVRYPHSMKAGQLFYGVSLRRNYCLVSRTYLLKSWNLFCRTAPRLKPLSRLAKLNDGQVKPSQQERKEQNTKTVITVASVI